MSLFLLLVSGCGPGRGGPGQACPGRVDGGRECCPRAYRVQPARLGSGPGKQSRSRPKDPIPARGGAPGGKGRTPDQARAHPRASLPADLEETAEEAEVGEGQRAGSAGSSKDSARPVSTGPGFRERLRGLGRGERGGQGPTGRCSIPSRRVTWHGVDPPSLRAWRRERGQRRGRGQWRASGRADGWLQTGTICRPKLSA